MSFDISMQLAVHWLRHSTCTTIFSGAGLSQASGIPTYRCAKNGLWTHPDNARFSSIEGVKAAPEEALAFWEVRREAMALASPNPGHYALAQLEELLEGPCNHITQNVDGLLTRAGCKEVVELHGSLERTLCMQDPSHTPGLNGHCATCNGSLRPDIVLFGEWLDVEKVRMAMSFARACDVMVVVGTRAEVSPASLTISEASRNGAKIIVIDPNPPYVVSPHKVDLRQNAEIALPAIVKGLKG